MSARPAGQRAPLRLTLVIGGLAGGGAERQLAEMANWWTRHGAQVVLASWGGREVADFYPLEPAIERIWLTESTVPGGILARATQQLRSIRRLRRLLRAWRPDALVSFIDRSNVCCIVAAAGLGIRTVVAERTHPGVNLRNVSWVWRQLRRICYPRADCVVAQTRDAADWLVRHCRAPVAVIPNVLRELPRLSLAREPLVVAVGRLSREKGFDLLLRAFARVEAQFPDWHLRIAGEGPERDALQAQAQALGIGVRVALLGEVRDVDCLLARAGLLVHPSRREGFPNVVLEAMGMGTAVVCTDCHAGPAELIQDGVNGRLVPLDDVGALAQAMAELMASSAARDALGQAARRVVRDYAPDTVMEKWQACVQPNVSSRHHNTWQRLRCRGARAWLGTLRRLFGFDPWHAAAPYVCRPYKAAVVQLADSVQPQLAVELGCGLGDIISRVRARERIGIDADARVIRAARFLHRRGRWIHGEGVSIPGVVGGTRRIDCLIMVNWIHALAPPELAALLLPLLPTTRHLILDAVDADGPHSYRHKHDFAFLSGLAQRRVAMRVPGEPRTFLLFEVMQ